MRALFGSEIAKFMLAGFVVGALAVGATHTVASADQGPSAVSSR